ncbi:MAG: LamG domain-containing protein [Myxococcota bacterium]
MRYLRVASTVVLLAALVGCGSSVLDPYAALEDDSLIAYWPFDSDARDFSPSGFHGQLQGNAAIVADAPVVQFTNNGALLLDGTGDWVECGDVLDMGVNDLTVAAWIKLAVGGTPGIIASKGGLWSGVAAWGVAANYSTANVEAYLRGSSTTYILSGSDGASLGDHGWHHVAFVFDRDGLLTRYVDGTPSGSATNLSALAGMTIDNPEPLRIGDRDAASGTEPWPGQIDDLRVYSRVLDGAEVARLAQGLASP